MFERLKSLWTNISTDSQSFVIDSTGYNGIRSQYLTLKEYKNIVYSCINVIAEDVAKYEPIFSKTDPEVQATPIQHPFAKILDNPRNDVTKYDLFLASQVYLELVGESYWYVELGEITRKPKTITFMRPDRVRHVYDGDRLAGFVYTRDGGQEIPLDLDEVIFHKRFNPQNPARGIGTVQAGILYIDTDTATSTFQNNFMRNQATPSGVLQVTGSISKEAFKKLKTIWAEQNAGLGNAGKTLFIRAAEAKFEKMGLSIGDIEMGTLRKLTKEDVREMFRVPAQLLGSTEQAGAGGLGRANLEAVEYIFAKRTIDPKLKKWDDVLQMAVRRYYGDDVFVTHKSQIPEDQATLLEEEKAGADKWITRNEIRKRRNLEPVQGGDTLYYESTKVPIGTKPQESAKTISAFPKKVIKVVMKSEKEDQYFNQLKRIENKAVKDFTSTLGKFLIKQERRVIERLGALYGQKKDVTDEISDVMSLGLDDAIADLYALLVLALTDAAKRGVSFTGAPDVDFILEQGVRNAIFDSTERLMKSFNEETAQLIQKAVAGGLAEGETIEQIKKRIEAVYSDAEGYRAERIARTEAHKSTNFGVAEGYRQSGVKKMKWKTLTPSCNFCAKMDGTITTIGQPFLVKGDKVVDDEGKEYVADYTDVGYADLHPNCDCKLIPA